MSKWKVECNNLSLGGFAPAYYKETYPSYGNKNQAGAMTNIDCTNPGYILQGPGLASLTAGTEAGAVTTLIRGMTDYACATNVAYGVGGAKLYTFSSTAVTNAGIWPHTIDKGTVTGEDGEDVALYNGNLYYSYNHSGSAGDIGIYDLSTTFNDDWASTVPSGKSTLSNAPHQMIVGGNDRLYIANGRYIASWDGTTFMPQALDFYSDTQISSIAWTGDRLWVAANRPNIASPNKNRASIYIWDGTTTSWSSEVSVYGTIGAIHVRNGVVFIFYQEMSSSGGYKLAYIDGTRIVDLANYSGSLPKYYQVTEHKDFILWISSGLVYAWGSGDKDLPVRFFQYADGGYSTVGGMASPFGNPIIASNQTTSYKLAQFSGLDVSSTWKSLMFDITGDGGNPSRIDAIRFNFEVLASGARVDWSLVNNKGVTIYSDIISYDKLGAATSAWYPFNGKIQENFRIQLDYASGSTSNSVAIKNIKCYGTI